MKGLEALKKLKNKPTLSTDWGKRKIAYDYNKIEFDIIEKELKALNIISQNFKLVGNCLHAKNKYAESGWVFVKELEDEEEHNAWKEALL